MSNNSPMNLCALLPHPLHISSQKLVCVHTHLRWKDREKQHKGNARHPVGLTCDCGETPRFCLLVHLAEVCTCFLLNALCPMLHQNPQSRLPRNRERRRSHIGLILHNLLHSPVEHSPASKAEGSGQGEPRLWVSSGPDVRRLPVRMYLTTVPTCQDGFHSFSSLPAGKKTSASIHLHPSMFLTPSFLPTQPGQLLF